MVSGTSARTGAAGGFRPPTPSQWEAIAATDDHLLVVAGAGTGKTHTVVGRVLYLLGVPINEQTYARPVGLPQIAAITYTKEAARDLKQQLRDDLRAAGRRELAWQVDLARIGTIHSFCAELLREHALRAGVAPADTVLEEGEALELATQAARDALVAALGQGGIAGLDALLGDRRTSDIDRWVVDLMRKRDLLRALHDRWRDADVGSEADAPTTEERALILLASAAAERYDRVLADSGRIDYDHMIHWTRDLLHRDAHVRAALRQRLHTLIVDEFQDVDPMQKEIAYAIGAVGEARADTPRLMLVGDPKQSIYRFRGADVSSWNSVQRDFEEQGLGRVLPLRENFRSLPPILAMVEASVGAALDQPIDGQALRDYEVPFLPVAAQRASAEATAVEFLLVPANAAGKSRRADDVRVVEAQAIAERMRQLHADRVRFSDMALLFATWTSVQIYQDALRRVGIPFYTLRRDGFLDTREVHDLVLALEVVRDPTDERALFGFLRSPFIGVSDETLLRVADRKRRPSWRHLCDVDADAAGESGAMESAEMERLAFAQQLLDRYTRLRDRLSSAELLDALLRETGFLAHLQLRGEAGSQALANVRQFIGLARATPDVSVGDFIRILREQRERGDRVPEAILYARDDEVVTITSIHVAKGLEWPVVFWADLSRGPVTFSSKLVVGRSEIRLGEPDIDADDQPDPRWGALRMSVIDEEYAEHKRLAYVAATRARDRLILCGIPMGGTGSGRDKPPSDRRREPIAKLFLSRFPQLANARSGDLVEFAGRDTEGEARARRHAALVHVATPSEPAPAYRPPNRLFGQTTEEAPQPWPTLDPAAIELPLEPVAAAAGPPRHSATEFLTYTRCPRRHWFKYVVGIREPPLAAAERDALISAVQRGQIVHDVLERLREEADLDSLLEDAIGRWDENAPAPESDRGSAYRAHLRDEVSRVVEHPDYIELASRPGARHELPFLYVAADGVAGQGSIDLAVPDTDAAGAPGMTLLDVKTTQCDAAGARLKAEQYAPQRDVYVTAATAIAGLPVHRFAFQFTRAAVQLTQDIDASGRAAAAGRFAESARQIAEEHAPLTRFPQECRFCGYRKVRLCPGARFDPPGLDDLFARLARDRFRSGFSLQARERAYLQTHGIDSVLEQARRFVQQRLAPASPARDGRQTPWRGHPVFVAQHGTATCCRSCVERWHGISRGVALTTEQQEYVLRVIERWLRAQAETSAGTADDSATAGDDATRGRRARDGSQLELL